MYLYVDIYYIVLSDVCLWYSRYSALNSSVTAAEAATLVSFMILMILVCDYMIDVYDDDDSTFFALIYITPFVFEPA